METLEKKNNRIISFDLLRVVAILYIIGFWHIDDYVKPVNIFSSPVTAALTLYALNIFVYISGFLLFARYGTIATFQDSKNFLAKRFLRLYPLYVSAVLLMLLSTEYNYKVIICALFFCNIILAINIKTLWFVSMIMMYYIFIPVIAYKYSVRRTLLISMLFIALAIMMHEYMSLGGIPFIERRLILYFPSFVLGILSAKHSSLFKLIKNKIFACIALACMISSVCLPDLIENHWISYFKLTVYLSISPLIVISEYLAPKVNQQFIIKLSYAAFCMYLYHRVIYWALLEIYYPATVVFVILYLLCVGIPVIYFLSRTVQGTYDNYVQKITTYSSS